MTQKKISFTTNNEVKILLKAVNKHFLLFLQVNDTFPSNAVSKKNTHIITVYKPPKKFALVANRQKIIIYLIRKQIL